MNECSKLIIFKIVDIIAMHGEGNTAKMVGDIMMTTDKIIKGLEGSIGLDVKSAY